MRSSSPVELLSVPHGHVAVHTEGTGPDLVFVHGWPTHAATWAPVVSHLARRFTCHRIDLPGSGSARVDGSPRLGFTDQAQAVVAALEALEIDRAVLIGHDSGGAVCRFAAAEMPDRVAGLVLTGTEIPSLYPGAITRLKMMAAMPWSNRIFRTMMNIGWVRRSSFFGFGVCFSDPAMIEGRFFDDTLRPLLDSDERLTVALEFLRQFDYRAMDRLAQVHARLDCVCMLLWGEDDPVFPLSDAREMASQFAGPVVIEAMPGGRLFPHEEFPEAYAASVERWIDSTAELESFVRKQSPPLEVLEVRSSALGRG